MYGIAVHGFYRDLLQRKDIASKMLCEFGIEAGVLLTCDPLSGDVLSKHPFGLVCADFDERVRLTVEVAKNPLVLSGDCSFEKRRREGFRNGAAAIRGRDITFACMLFYDWKHTEPTEHDWFEAGDMSELAILAVVRRLRDRFSLNKIDAKDARRAHARYEPELLSHFEEFI